MSLFHFHVYLNINIYLCIYYTCKGLFSVPYGDLLEF